MGWDFKGNKVGFPQRNKRNLLHEIGTGSYFKSQIDITLEVKYLIGIFKKILRNGKKSKMHAAE